MKRLYLIAGAASLAAFTTTAIAATPLAPLAGSEIRRDVSYAPWHRYEVLRLNADGTFSGNYEARRPTIRGKGEVRSGLMSGRWSVENGQLCLVGAGLLDAGRNCYRLTKGGFSKRQWSATNTRTGDVWQFFVYPRGN